MDFAKYQIDVPDVVQDVRQQGSKLPRDYSLGVYDIGCGRGQRFCTHAGNLRFREIVNSHVDRYLMAHSKIAKTALIVSILDEVRKGKDDGFSKGRFVKQQDDGSWIELGDAASRDKVSNALRSAVASRRGGYGTVEAAVATLSSSFQKAGAAKDKDDEGRESRDSNESTFPLLPRFTREDSSEECPRLVLDNKSNNAMSCAALLQSLGGSSFPSSLNHALQMLHHNSEHRGLGPEEYQQFSDISAVINAFYGRGKKDTHQHQTNTGLNNPMHSAIATMLGMTPEDILSGAMDSLSSLASGNVHAKTLEQKKPSKSPKAHNGSSSKSPSGRKKRSDAGKKRKPNTDLAGHTLNKTSKRNRKMEGLETSPSPYLAVSSQSNEGSIPVTPHDDSVLVSEQHAKYERSFPVVTPREELSGSSRLCRPSSNLVTLAARPSFDQSELESTVGALQDLDAVSSLLLLKAGYKE